jgi:hypothetical protein
MQEQSRNEKSQADQKSNSPFVLVRSKAQIRTRRKPAHHQERVEGRNGWARARQWDPVLSVHMFSQPNAPMPDGTINLTPSAQPNPGSNSVAGPTGNGGGSSNPNPAFNIAQAISSLSSSAGNWTALSSKRECTGGCARKWWVV